MGKLLPVILAVLGLGLGAGAGVLLRPESADMPEHAEKEEPDAAKDNGAHAASAATEDDATNEFVKLNNQFVVPVVDGGHVSALVVLSLSLQVTAGQRETVYKYEPKLRDAFLQVFFDHANAGGFKGMFTESTKMNVLRIALRETAQKVMGPIVADVLIVDLMRQDT